MFRLSLLQAQNGNVADMRRVAGGLAIGWIAIHILFGCDPANVDVYLVNNTDHTIRASFPLDDTSCHALVPPHARVRVLKNNFEGPHKAIIEEMGDRPSHHEVDYSEIGEWRGTSVTITYPPAVFPARKHPQVN